jgi:hypothetical protein
MWMREDAGRPRHPIASTLLGLLLALAGCYSTSPSRGGGQQSKFDGVRKINPAA